jgi:hypothetical protein
MGDIESWATWLFLFIAWTLCSFLVGSLVGRAAHLGEPETHGDDGGHPNVKLFDEAWAAPRPANDNKPRTGFPPPGLHGGNRRAPRQPSAWRAF